MYKRKWHTSTHTQLLICALSSVPYQYSSTFSYPVLWLLRDDMAARDLPAMLTHELMVTGAPDVSYIGHSQGTTIAMAFTAMHAGSALAERIKVTASSTAQQWYGVRAHTFVGWCVADTIDCVMQTPSGTQLTQQYGLDHHSSAVIIPMVCGPACRWPSCWLQWPL